jgi:hypothetical protein
VVTKSIKDSRPVIPCANSALAWAASVGAPTAGGAPPSTGGAALGGRVALGVGSTPRTKEEGGGVSGGRGSTIASSGCS